MKDEVLEILNQYLELFPNEKERQKVLIEYLEKFNDKEIIDWNNFNGHIVASGFLYARKERKFLVLWHKDLKMFLYPGGHVNLDDENILEAAKREVREETGLDNFEQAKIAKNKLIPFDIDTQNIRPNERLNLPRTLSF